jgi:hypothetical protein
MKTGQRERERLPFMIDRIAAGIAVSVTPGDIVDAHHPFWNYR